MRKLKAKDLGAFSKIVSKMDIKEEVISLFSSVEGKDEEQLEQLNKKLAAELILILVSNYWKAENEFYKLLSSLSGKTPNEIEESSPSELISMLEELAKDESLQHFFKLVA